MDTIEMRKRAEQALKSSGLTSKQRQLGADVLALCDALDAEDRVAGRLLGQDAQALAAEGRQEAEAVAWRAIAGELAQALRVVEQLLPRDRRTFRAQRQQVRRALARFEGVGGGGVESATP